MKTMRFVAATPLVAVLASCWASAPAPSRASANAGVDTGPVARLRTDAAAVLETPRFAARAELYRDEAGMLFAFLPQSDSYVVRVDVRYRSGAAADPAGKEGLAHLVEHLSFHLRTAADAPTLAARLSRDALVFNAYTSWDETHYFATALAPQAEALIAIESDRLGRGCAALDEDTLARERRIVVRELESKRADDAVHTRIRRAVFAPSHPYHGDVGGRADTIAALSLKDVCAFMEAQYRPTHVIMVVSGRIEVAAVKAAVERRYGPLSTVSVSDPANAPRVLAATSTAAAAWSRPTDDTIRAAVEKPTLVAVVASPRWGVTESVHHRLAMSLFGERLAELVKVDDRLEVSGSVRLGGWNHGAHGVFVQSADEDGLASAERLVRELSADPFYGMGEGALAAAKARFVTDVMRAHDSNAIRAVLVAETLQYGDAVGVDAIRAAVDSVSRRELEALIRTSVRDMGLIRVLPEDAEAARLSLAAASSTSSGLRSLVVADGDGELASSLVPLVDEGEADHDLALPALPPYQGTEIRRLASGLRVVLLPRMESRMVFARMVFAGGRRTEPANRRGLSEFAATLRKSGLSAPWSDGLTQDLAEVATLPVEISTTVDATTTVFRGASPSRHARALLWNLHMLVRYGGYVDLSDLSKVWWRGYLDGIAERQQRSVQGLVDAAIAGEGAGERELAALQATVAALQKQDLTAYGARAYRPDRGTLVVTGNFDTGSMMTTIEELFDDWRPLTTASISAGQPAAKPGREPDADRNVLLVTDESTQARVVAVYPDVFDGQQQAAALVLQTMLETRLARELRERIGATYHVEVTFRGSALVIDTKLGGAHAGQALATVHAIATSLDDARFRSDFVLARRKAVERALATSMSAAALIEHATHAAIGDGGNHPLDELAQQIATLRPAHVSALVKSSLAPSRARLVIAASEELGQTLFGVIGVHEPRIVQ